MSFYDKYTETKDSLVPWLGCIPSHWKLRRLKNTFRIRKSIAGALGHDVLSITQKGIRLKDTKSGDGQLSMDYSKYQLVRPGDFAMNHMDLITGFVDISKYAGVTSPDYRVFELTDGESDPRFWLYVFQLCYLSRIFFPLGQGAAHIGRWRLPTEGFNQFVGAIPTLQEQQKIANFLDHETAKIDTLIEKQQQLIKLLKEKRQAVISHAVTKGLNPDAPMKDSRVEWLGEVPEGWIVRRLKSLIESGTSISYGIVQPGDRQDDGVPFIQTTNISRGDFDIQNLHKTTSEIAAAFPRSKLSGGEVILGIRASIGAAYVVPEHLKGANLSRGIARIVPSKSLLSEFLVDYLRSQVVFDYWGLGSQGSTFSEVSIDTVKELFLVVPPLSEQKEICSYVSHVSRAYESLMNRATELSRLQKERRTALISAAVAGKIDVRNWQPPKATSTPSTDA